RWQTCSDSSSPSSRNERRPPREAWPAPVGRGRAQLANQVPNQVPEVRLALNDAELELWNVRGGRGRANLAYQVPNQVQRFLRRRDRSVARSVSISASAAPAPRATVVSGSSSREIGSPVSRRSSSSKPRRSVPPPTSVIPRVAMSDDSSAGVRSR